MYLMIILGHTSLYVSMYFCTTINNQYNLKLVYRCECERYLWIILFCKSCNFGNFCCKPNLDKYMKLDYSAYLLLKTRVSQFYW